MVALSGFDSPLKLAAPWPVKVASFSYIINRSRLTLTNMCNVHINDR